MGRPISSPAVTSGLNEGSGGNALSAAVEAAEGPFAFEGDTILIYRGEAEAVQFVQWMPRFPSAPPFSRNPDGTWFLRLPLPQTARVEYRLAVVRPNAVGKLRIDEIDDPLNPPSAVNPFGTNSVLAGPGYQSPWHRAVPPETKAGEVIEIRVTSRVLGGRRHHHLYLPPDHDPHKPYPLLLVHDGSDFLRFANLAGCLDLLIDQDQMAPLVAVLLDPWVRIAEYGANPRHTEHLAEEVMPHLSRRLRLLADRRHVGLMGSSLGAVASLAALWHRPEVFGRVALISGSFANRVDDEWPSSVFDPVVAFLRDMETDLTIHDTRIYQSVGRYEGLCDFNRRLGPILRGSGADLLYRETWDGHHWGSWRDRLGEALSFLFPPRRHGRERPAGAHPRS